MTTRARMRWRAPFSGAVISGTELRLVVTAQIVRRVLGINGLDRLVSIYPTLEAATAPRARPRGAGARLAGLRKDGTTFPVEISLSPVTTAAGQFTVSVIRDVTETRRAEKLAGLAAAAVAAEQAHRGQELLDTAITSLFRVGLSLQAAIDLPAELTRQRIAEALGHLDDTIREIRNTAFTIATTTTP